MKNLKTLIQANNEHSKQAKKFYLEALEQASKLIGKKVKTAKNEAAKNWTVKLEHVKGQINGGFLDVHAWFNFSGNSIWLNVKTCFNGGSYDNNTAFCHYLNTSMYLGDMENGILTATASEGNRESWLNHLKEVTFEEVTEKAEKYKALQEEAEKLYREIPEEIAKAMYLKR